MAIADFLPDDHAEAMLVGRMYDPSVSGPVLVHAKGDRLVDITSLGPTMSHLLERPDLISDLNSAPQALTYPLDEVIKNSLLRRLNRPHLLSPSDLQTIKACGVTFARSMIERVIEERAQGDYRFAQSIREKIGQAIGGQVSDIKPGSREAVRVKAVLMESGLWSQYLEVGIGPDAEVFTKAPVLSSVGFGAEIGILRKSSWNNPEPEVVLAIDSHGRVRGATLGNDVNLRDIEGRSSLLLGKAKDNNASCALGPFIRLLDPSFTIDDIRQLKIRLTINGSDDPYELRGMNSMEEISRDPLELVQHAFGSHHQYPDGFMLFLGTLFAPTQDRDAAGQGFTHKVGDQVTIAAPKMGALFNTVTYSEDAAPWTFGITSLMRNLAERGLLLKTKTAY